MLGRVTSNNKWYEQILGEKANSLAQLTEEINEYFIGLTAEFEPLPPAIPDATLMVPDKFLVSESKCYWDLRAVNCRKSSGPDQIPNRLLKEFAQELAPVVCNIYNTSIIQGVVPLPLKQSIVSPIPKCTPLTSIQSDLRPISLTPQLSKIMEGFILKPLLHEISSKIDCFQFAMKGRSTTQALVSFYTISLKHLTGETVLYVPFSPILAKDST